MRLLDKIVMSVGYLAHKCAIGEIPHVDAIVSRSASQHTAKLAHQLEAGNGGAVVVELLHTQCDARSQLPHSYCAVV